MNPPIKTVKPLSEFCSTRQADPHSVVNPSTGETITSVVEGMEADVEKAVQAADEAFNTTWGLNTPGFERGKLLIKIAELMERDLDILASIEALDNGKTFSVAKAFDVSDSSSKLELHPSRSTR
jgi:aldehyde dehydrogenase (NAD+)